jgi:prevent-host-death family protein
MSDRYSIAEARHNLAALVHDLERTPRIELTRRGEPVAVLLSLREYRRLSRPAPDFWQAYQQFRKTVEAARTELNPDDVFDKVRDRSAGRNVRV